MLQQLVCLFPCGRGGDQSQPSCYAVDVVSTGKAGRPNEKKQHDRPPFWARTPCRAVSQGALPPVAGPAEGEGELPAFLRDVAQRRLDARPFAGGQARRTDGFNHLCFGSVAHLLPGGEVRAQAVEGQVTVAIVGVSGSDRADELRERIVARGPGGACRRLRSAGDGVSRRASGFMVSCFQVCLGAANPLLLSFKGEMGECLFPGDPDGEELLFILWTVARPAAGYGGA
jgi:hypothetical protein